MLRYRRIRSGCLLRGRPALENAHDVRLFHDQIFGAVDLDLGARPLAEQDNVASLDVDRDQLARFVAATRADGDDLALHRLFLGGFGDDDATLGLGVFLNSAHNHSVVQRTELHAMSPSLVALFDGVAGAWSNESEASQPRFRRLLALVD